MAFIDYGAYCKPNCSSLPFTAAKLEHLLFYAILFMLIFFRKKNANAHFGKKLPALRK